ncbi:MAG: ornithine carbamoyltransferase [Alphaproteobacteria bacterium]
MIRHFLDLDQIEPNALRQILDQARQIKANPEDFRGLNGQTIALIFEKPSTRTRVSFEVGIRQLGGEAVVLTGAEMQLGRGETIGDTARVMSRFVDMMMIRTGDPHKLDELAAGATIPVINGLTNATHPCQVMADIMTVEERVGPAKGRTIAWVGDGENNVLNSLIQASAAFGFQLRIACPAELGPSRERITLAQAKGARISVGEDARQAVAEADAVVTDTWVSMHNTDAAHRHALLEPYRVNASLMQLAPPHAIFLHCLPAHRGEEVTDEVIDSAQSAVWDEAENRLHVQKAIMLWCLEHEDK